MLPRQHLPGAKRSWGQSRGYYRHLWTKREMQIVAQSRGGRHWQGLWESLYLIWFSLFKNKLQSSGRGEVGGNACAGGEGGRAGQRPAARKTTSHHSPRARKKAVEHPHSQEAPEPGKSRWQRLRRPSSCHGPPALHIDGAGSTPLHQAPLSWGHFSKIYRRRERDGTKTRHRGHTDWPEVPQGDAGVPARAKPLTLQLRTRPAQAKATKLREVFQSLETRRFTCPVPGWRGMRTGSTGSTAQPPGRSLGRCPHAGTPPVRGTCMWQLPGDVPHPSCSSPGSSSSGPLCKALAALGAVCFSRDLPLQLEFIWGFMPGPPPRVTVNNSPPRQPPMLTHDSGGRQPGEQLLLFP